MNTIQSHLLHAAGELRQAIDRLNIAESVCEHCGRVTWEDRSEYKAAMDLTAMCEKLDRLRAKLSDDRDEEPSEEAKQAWLALVEVEKRLEADGKLEPEG